MKKIKLINLHIKNFKGCGINAPFAHEIYDKTNIYGANATGKTTLVDAFMWLLFNKDSAGSSTFDIRPLDSAGNVIDRVEVLVEATLEVDGTQTVLLKRQTQKWTKKRGTSTEVLAGNINAYEIDGFPASEKGFKEKVEEIMNLKERTAEVAPEELFKILTDPNAFPLLPWKKQRSILTGLKKEVTDVDILEADPEKYAPIADEVRAAGVAKVAEKAKDTAKKLDARASQIPSEITGAQICMVQVPELADLELQRNALNEQLTEIQKQRDDAGQAYKAVAELQAELMKARFDMNNLVQTANDRLAKQRRDAERAYIELENDAHISFQKRKTKEAELENLKSQLEAKEAEKATLAEAWKNTKKMQMNESETVCQMCGQPLPADQIEQIKADFEIKKEKTLNDIVSKGNAANAEICEMKEKINATEAEITTLKQEWSDATSKKNKAEAAKDAIPAEADVTEAPEYQCFKARYKDLQEQLAGMDSGEELKLQLAAKEKEIRQELDAVNRRFAAVDSNEKIQERIDNLRIEQRDVGQKLADQQQKVFLLEEFMRLKMQMLENQINSMFNVVRFKFFETQLNGVTKDICEMSVNGVPYSSLNSAAKMQAGLDVIAVLSDYYEINAPIWLDNRESVSVIPNMDAQIVNLYVSPNDQNLRIEVAL